MRCVCFFSSTLAPDSPGQNVKVSDVRLLQRIKTSFGCCPQGFSLKKWDPFFKGKALGTRLNRNSILITCHYPDLDSGTSSVWNF